MKNKTLLLLGILFVILAPFIINFSLIYGLLFLVLGIITIISYKKNKKLPIIIGCSVIIALLLGHILVNTILLFGYDISYLLNSLYVTTPYDRIYQIVYNIMFYGNYYDIILKAQFHIYSAFVRIDVIRSTSFVLLMTVLILLFNSISSNKKVKLVSSIILFILSICLIAYSLDNTLYLYRFICNVDTYIPLNHELRLRHYLFPSGSLSLYTLSGFLVAKYVDAYFNNILLTTYLSLIISVTNFIVLLNSIKNNIKEK